MIKKSQILFGLAALLPLASAQAISVTANNNANDLVSAILGSGITVSGAPTYTGGALASGTFTGGLAAGIGIDSGILLTSGTATLAQGPNNSGSATGNNGLAGDASLNTLVSPGQQTHDASSLTFNFSTAGGNLFFNFVFASEEYNEYANTAYNDVFGFFLDGVNIALLPGTTTPVSINTVNGGNPLGTNAQHPEFYNNNPVNANLQYDGFTDVFTAQALNLSAGIHTIKLAIADTSDYILDSGVFIQGGSFSENPTDPNPVPDGGSVTLVAVGAMMLANRFMRRRA